MTTQVTARGGSGRRGASHCRSVLVAALIVSLSAPALAEPTAAYSEAPATAQPPVYAQPHPTYVPERPLYDPPPAPTLHLVGFTSDTPNARFAIELDRSRQVLGWCRDACWMYLRPGRYRVEVAEAGGVAAGERTFKLEGPALVGVSPGSQTARFTWLGLGLGSTVVLVAGALTTLAWVGNHDDEGEDRRAPLWMPVMALTGFVMTPLSWIMFGRTSKPGVNIEARGR